MFVICISAISRVCANKLQARCLCSENVAIGFKTSIKAYFVEKSARTLELLKVHVGIL